MKDKAGIIDFKTKLNNLLLAASEVTGYIKQHDTDITRDTSKRQEIVHELDGLKTQIEDFSRQVTALRAEKQRLTDEIASLRTDAEIKNREIESQISRNLEQSKKILHDAQKRESELYKATEEFNEKKRDLESRHAKIAELAK